MPITVLSRKQVTDGTWDDLMTIIAWSLRFAALGQHPRARHNGAPWLPSDFKRTKKVHSCLRSCLVEVRADWKFHGETFSFPKWNTKAGMCWRCTCTPEEVRSDFVFRQVCVIQVGRWLGPASLLYRRVDFVMFVLLHRRSKMCAQVRDVGPTAAWRSSTRTHFQRLESYSGEWLSCLTFAHSGALD